MDVYLRYYIGAAFSFWSISVTYICASEPDPPAIPTLRLGTVDVIIVDWDVPAWNGGSNVLGYRLYMKLASSGSFTLVYDGYQDAVTKY